MFIKNYKTEELNINEVKVVEVLSSFYDHQDQKSEEQLSFSLKSSGQLLPLTVSVNNELIDGYRRLNLLRRLGVKSVKVQIVEEEPTLELRVALNTTRIKTDNDLTKEVIQIFKSVPKRQGKREGDEKYDRYAIIQKKLDYRWKSSTAIRQIDKIIENDFEDNLLMNGIVTKGWTLTDCERYVDSLKKVDVDRELGFTEKLKKGKININEAVKFIIEAVFLSTEYQDTFIIPDRSSSFNLNCKDINPLVQFKGQVPFIFTSIPYYSVRYYNTGEGSDQLGHERTPEQFAANIGKIISRFEFLLNPTSNVMINIGETYRNGCALDIPGLVKNAIKEHTGLTYKDTLIWSKPNPHPQGEKVNRPTNNTEVILWFVVDPAKSKYNHLKYTDEKKQIGITKGAKDVNQNGVVSKKSKSLSKPYKKIYNHLAAQDVNRMIKCAVGGNKPVQEASILSHPAMMAELLPVVPILMTTDENDLVFDPFGGVNTTGRIANLLNRRYLSTELTSQYYQVGCKVMENAQKEFNQDELSIVLNEFNEAA